ncbi:extracellular catalytic domain type 2 short-chain-length polyhydroxyalkanoate depolymerase [Streptomyces sp. Tue6028]|uniref:extracellular catalytic domain type 2 short-chain-length polyhydroxyalkanoate depolymerase n=1 Tax=Streptomyces sp. Tue6028 TaxID=2036037 RepID=UPI003D71EB5C
MRASPAALFRRLIVLLSLVAAVLVLPTATDAAAAAPAPVPGDLKPYDVDAVYSAGVSSGGYMATQLHVAYSGTFKGSAVFAAGPYDCAQNDLNKALNACMDTLQDLQLDKLEQTTRDWSAQGLVDPVANLSGDPVYVFSGSGDTTVKRPVADALAAYYGRFGAQVRYDNSTTAGHAWISPLGPNSCTVTQSPWINNCGIDAERDLLGHLLGSVAAPSGGPTGTLTQFDQNKYVPGGAAKAVSMDDKGFVYVPTACAGGAACKLVVALHGCKQGYSYQGFGSQFIDKAYLDEYADTNHLIVLYPQAVATTTLDNPNGCWNWWGYLGDSAYARHGGKQIEAIMAMVKALSGSAPPPVQNTVTAASVDSQDGYVKAAADGTGAAVGTLESTYGLAVGRGSDGKHNRTVLSFDTSQIPAGKQITRAYVTLTRSSGVGDPWSSPAGNRLLVDVNRGCLGGCSVEASDWAATATAPGAAVVGSFSSGSRSSTDLSAAGLAAIDRTGTTQVRLRFESNPASTAYLFVNKDTRATLTVEYQ